MLQLQRYQERQSRQEADVPAATVSRVNTPSTVRPPAKKRPPSTSSKIDEDWVLDTPKRSRPNKTNESKKDEVG